MNDLSELIERSKQGDLEAYGLIVRRFKNMAYGYAASILSDFHLAQDAAQEAFVEAHRQLGQLREAKAFPGWLRRIVFKQCDRIIRSKQAPTLSIESVADPASDDPGAFRALERREMKEEVLGLIRALPEKERTATTLFYINGYSHREVSEFLEVPVSTVKNRLHSSRKKLREQVMKKVDETLKAFPLTPRFAEVVDQMTFVMGRVNPLATKLKGLADLELGETARALRTRLGSGEDRDCIRAEAFALVREASDRALGQAHYDVQLVAGMMLDEGWVAEQSVGEGKSITCFPAAFMSALEGMRVHVVTVNDYLAARDASSAEKVFSLLGMRVGHLSHDEEQARLEALGCDITYGTAARFCLENIADRSRKAAVAAPEKTFAIIDEVDSVLIDWGATPLVVSKPGPTEEAGHRRADAVARPMMAEEDPQSLYNVDGTCLAVDLTGAGAAKARALSPELFPEDHGNDDCVDLVALSLRAHLLYAIDRDYLVQDGKIVLIDESTGRALPGRMWSDGLHQAVECKEGLAVTRKPAPMDSVRIDRYFRQYRKLSGTTGSAIPQAREFREIYGMKVAAVPTRSPVNRVDYEDRVYRDIAARDVAIADDVFRHCVELKRPVLVVAPSIGQCERLSELLAERHGIKHEVLNARAENAEREGSIIASAGRLIGKEGDSDLVGAVTVATPMAGRGTDIALDDRSVCSSCRVPSGPGQGRVKCCVSCEEYDEPTQCRHCFKPSLDRRFPTHGRTSCCREMPCGLHVIGAGRLRRRFDMQLRNRAGRQGQPGSSRFFLALDEEPAASMARDAAQDLDFEGRDFLEGPEISRGIARAAKALEAGESEIRIRMAGEED